MRPLAFSGGLAYAIVFWTIYVSWIALETLVSRAKWSDDSAKTRDRGSFTLINILLWFALSLGFTLAFILPQATILWKRPVVFFIGIGLMLAGIAFRFYSMSLLGRFFTYDVAVHGGQTVIEAGPYRYIRHPSYAGILITLAGVGFALGNWASLIVILFCMGLAFGYRMSVEEAALIAALGHPYEQYIRRTRRLIPFLF